MNHSSIKLLIVAIFLASCNSQPTSQLQASTVIANTLTCKALWVCKGQSTPMGEVTSKAEYPAGAYELCREDLVAQVADLNWCPDGEEVLAESVAATTNQVVRKILTPQSENGFKLLKLLTTIREQLDAGCYGDSCFAYWQKLVDTMYDLPSWPPYLEKMNLTISGDIAKAAYQLGNKLCTVRHTAEPQWMDIITVRSRTSAEVARYLQLRFGTAEPAYCLK